MCPRGPPLVETLKDPNMLDTFRTTAFDLIQIILAADTSALASFSSKAEGSVHPWCHLLEIGNNESGHELSAATKASQDQKYWKVLKKVSDTISEGHEKWFCVPLLWIEVLGGVLAYPTSFYKSVLWAYGRIAIVDSPGKSTCIPAPTLSVLFCVPETIKSLKREARTTVVHAFWLLDYFL